MKITIPGKMMIVLALIPATADATLSVEQRDYLFVNGLGRDYPASTFVIGDWEEKKALRPPGPAPMPGKDKLLLTIRKTEEAASQDGPEIENATPVIPPVFFELAGFSLSREAENGILAALADNKVGKASPLKITGYTCDLGPPRINWVLAMQRAVTVARFLREHGYEALTVSGAAGQGQRHNAPETRHLNRRVEINILAKPGDQRRRNENQGQLGGPMKRPAKTSTLGAHHARLQQSGKENKAGIAFPGRPETEENHCRPVGLWGGLPAGDHPGGRLHHSGGGHLRL